MDEKKRDGPIYEGVKSLIRHLCLVDLKKDTGIAVFQIIADKNCQVFLPDRHVRDPRRVKEETLLLSFASLEKKLLSVYEKEKTESFDEMEKASQEARTEFQQMREEALRIINEAEEKLLNSIFPYKLTTKLIDDWIGQKIENDQMLLERLEEVLRSYGLEKRLDLMRNTLTAIQNMKEEIKAQVSIIVTNKLKAIDLRCKDHHLKTLPRDFLEEQSDAPLPIQSMGLQDLSTIGAVKERKTNMIEEFVYSRLGGEVSLELLFRGSRDGFGADIFHSKCDSQGPTLLLVETTDGKTVGGFASKSWESGSRYQFDEKAFLFSWDLEEIYPIKPEKAGNALLFCSNYGPAFGSGLDLYIADECNESEANRMNLNSSYQCERKKEEIIGRHNFKVKDYEVFAVNLIP